MDTEPHFDANHVPPKHEVVIGVDIALWRAGARKLSLKETGELMRALMRAQSSRRPNREQRMLLALFTRKPDEEIGL